MIQSMFDAICLFWAQIVELQVEHLLGDCDDQGLDAVHAQDSTRAKRAGQYHDNKR